MLLCAVAGTGLILSACGSHSTGPTPIVEQPAPQPTPQPPAPPPPAPVLGVTRILAFGDSMTAGTTSPAAVISALTAGLSQSYPAKLQDLVTARYTGQTVTVLNAGKPSESPPQCRRFVYRIIPAGLAGQRLVLRPRVSPTSTRQLHLHLSCRN